MAGEFELGDLGEQDRVTQNRGYDNDTDDGREQEPGFGGNDDGD